MPRQRNPHCHACNSTEGLRRRTDLRWNFEEQKWTPIYDCVQCGNIDVQLVWVTVKVDPPKEVLLQARDAAAEKLSEILKKLEECDE